MNNRSRRILRNTALGAAAGGAVFGAAGYVASNESDGSYFPAALIVGSIAGAIFGSIYSLWRSPPAKIKDGFEEKVHEAKKSALMSVSLFKPEKPIELPIALDLDISEEEYFQLIENVWESDARLLT